MKRYIAFFGFALLLLQLLSCSNWEAKEQAKEEPKIFPDYVGVTVPRSIAPLDFGIEGVDHIEATATVAGESIKGSGDDYVEFDEEEWHGLLSKGKEIDMEVSVWDKAHPEGVTYAHFPIYLRNDTIDPWIMYRLIPPGYEGWNKMGIYQRRLSDFDQEVITNNTDNGKGCMNCHSACQGNPDTFTFHSRSQNGGTIICRNGQMEKINLKDMEPGLNGSYNYWHPSGKWIAFSSNQTVQCFFSRSRDKIEGYDLRGDIILYNVDKHKVYTDNRFLDSLSLESFPTFSPDGKWLYFVSAHAVDMPMEYEKLKYNILRVPFDEATGALGTVDTVWSAAKTGRSAIIPRISPDGRYLMYSTSPAGALNLYHNDSDLGMIDLKTGAFINCETLNSEQSESYHSWTRNSRWVMFSSKRVDGRFTRLFFSHWDGKQWTKPFMLPQQNPWQNTLNMCAYNVPDFIIKPVCISREELRSLIGEE